MKDFNAEGASATRVPNRPPCPTCKGVFCMCYGDGTETRECENCGKQKPIDEMETVFARGHGETYQCIECRGGP